MNAADYALMADPDHNRQFRRRWDDPAPPHRERHSPTETDALDGLARALRDDWREARG